MAKRRKRTHRAIDPNPASRRENRASQSDRGNAWWGGRRATVTILTVALVIAFVGWFYRSPRDVSRVEHTAEQSRTPAVAVSAEAATYVGRTACATCHAEQDRLWQGSHHALAMQVANAATVLGDFNNATFEYAGIESRFFTKDGRFFVTTDGPDGKLRDYEVAYTFGIDPLQQYLIAFPNGRLQALSIAWDTRPKETGGQRWFHLYPNERITHTDPLHWTGMYQNWNYMCAECHSTDLRRGYDAQLNRYQTRWSEINVSCEACHGPGSQHLAWARDPQRVVEQKNAGLVVRFDERKVAAWTIDPRTGNATRSPPRKTDVELQACARCHSRRGSIWSEYRHDRPLLDSYHLQTLAEGLYYSDGQILDEVYEYGSFLQSKMYRAGVTCSDCHNPHSGKLRAEGNALCAACHLPSKYDTVTHHHHRPASAGAACVACHMPTATYMVVDPRRDHSLRAPRPDLSEQFDVPNACGACHANNTAKWAAQTIANWNATFRGDEQTQSYAAAIQAARAGHPASERLLAEIARNPETPGIRRATAIRELRRYLSLASSDILQVGAKAEDPLVRSATAELLEAMEPTLQIQLGMSLLKDQVRAVRLAAALALAGVPESQLSAAQQDILNQALDEYLKAQEASAERPEAHVNLGVLYTARRRFDAAEVEYRKAIDLQPYFVGAYVNLADLYRVRGRDDQGKTVLRNGLARLPDNADLYHALGLLQVRRKHYDDAVASLREATRLNPTNAHYSYVYAVALNSMGRTEQALSVLKQAQERNTVNQELLLALVDMNRSAGNLAEATTYAKALAALAPTDMELQKLLADLTAQSDRP